MLVYTIQPYCGTVASHARHCCDNAVDVRTASSTALLVRTYSSSTSFELIQPRVFIHVFFSCISLHCLCCLSRHAWPTCHISFTQPVHFCFWFLRAPTYFALQTLPTCLFICLKRITSLVLAIHQIYTSFGHCVTYRCTYVSIHDCRQVYICMHVAKSTPWPHLCWYKHKSILLRYSCIKRHTHARFTHLIYTYNSPPPSCWFQSPTAF